ncbi:sulfotransferase family domain-containing protein [Ditylenchus destructor]|uniref:Sulfotransferase family domain-containing protein n=1 Tax=Ditylenchus destructor TaxID=166010 RepID=A0AAD4QS64_9BILA|nr:sulfotransferase family domain-containing protein [Ditylenchus destructor]
MWKNFPSSGRKECRNRLAMPQTRKCRPGFLRHYETHCYTLPTTSAFGTKSNGQSLCIGGDEARCLPKFMPYENHIMMAPKYKTATCLISKNMSTIMTALMCLLHATKRFLAEGRKLTSEDWEFRICRNGSDLANEVIERNNTDCQLQLMSEFKLLGWKMITVVRDPVDRFLSGFLDKCIGDPVYGRLPGHLSCNGCGMNITCFILTEYERLMTQSKMLKLDMTFEDDHFAPQNWQCYLYRQVNSTPAMSDLINEDNIYSFIRYDAFSLALQNVLEQQQVPKELIDFIQRDLNSSRVYHATTGSEARSFLEQRLRSSSFLMEYITVCKASKVVPTMIMGRMLRKQRYSTVDYLMALVLIAGAATFFLTMNNCIDISKKSIEDSNIMTTHFTTTSGLILMFIYLVCDAFTPNFQKTLLEAKVSRCQMMFYTNAVSAFLCLATLLQHMTVFSSLNFVLSHNGIFTDCLILSIAGSLGQEPQRLRRMTAPMFIPDFLDFRKPYLLVVANLVGETDTNRLLSPRRTD